MKSNDVELIDLRRRLARLRQEAKNNELTWRRSQQREMVLLEAEDLPALLNELTDGLRHSFGLQACTLILADPDHELRHVLGNVGVDLRQVTSVRFVDHVGDLLPTLADSGIPALGRYSNAVHRKLFPPAPELASVALVPLLRKSLLVGCLCFGSAESGRFTSEHGTDFLRHLGIIAAFSLENAMNRARLVKRGFTDELTGWNNRRYLDTRLAEEIARSRRDQTTLVCMLLDVDHFKQVNDRFGHTAGDEVLREVARRMAGEIRDSDISARFGGEEFVILMPYTTLDAAYLVAERVRRTVASAPFTIPASEGALPAADEVSGSGTGADRPVAVTISIGLSCYEGAGQDSSLDASAQYLLAEADRALYSAKAAGRNTIVAAGREALDDHA